MYLLIAIENMNLQKEQFKHACDITANH